MPRSLRYDEPYLLDERAVSPIKYSGLRWSIGLVRFRRILPIAGCSSESWLTTHYGHSFPLKATTFRPFDDNARVPPQTTESEPSVWLLDQPDLRSEPLTRSAPRAAIDA
jgi:hypothetical protein